MHEHPSEKLTLLAGGDLSDAEARQVKGHLEGCASCRAEYERVQEVVGHLAGLPRSEATFAELMAQRARHDECERVSEALTACAYGGSDHEAEMHLQGCPRCAATLAGIQHLMRELDVIGSSKATFFDLRRVMRQRRLRRWGFASAASLLAVLALGGLIPSRSRPTESRHVEISPSTPMDTARALVGRVISSLDSVDDSAMEAAALRLDRGSLLQTLALGEMMEDSRDSLRSYAAIRLLRHFETPSAEDLLARGLGRHIARDPLLVRALVDLQSRRATPWLIRQLDDPSRRRQALEDLAALKDPSAIGTMADFLDSDSERSRVGELLSRFPARRLIEAGDRDSKGSHFVAIPNADLQAHLVARAVEDESFRIAAFAAASESGPSGVEFLVRAFHEKALAAEALTALKRSSPASLERGIVRCLDQEELEQPALRLIAELKMDRFIPDLQRGTLSGRFHAGDALPVLVKLDGEATVTFVLKLLSDEKQAKAAVEALRGVDGKVLTAAAAPLLRDSRYARPVLGALNGMARPDLGPLFVEALRIPDLRRQAIEMVVRLQYTGAVPVLIPYLDSEGTARQAEQALKEITGQDFGRDRGQWGRWWRKNS